VDYKVGVAHREISRQANAVAQIKLINPMMLFAELPDLHYPRAIDLDWT
jgi:hypothetical protein